MKKLTIVSLMFMFCFFNTGAAKGEVITLVDNSKVYGEIVHYYDGVLTIKSPSKVELKLPVEKIKHIKFKLPKPDPAFSKPKKTFARYREALAKGDIEKLISCFALQYQTMMMHQLGAMSLQDINNMRQAVKATNFKVKSTRFKKNMAFLKISQTHGKQTADAEIQFVKENGEWKMIPGQGPMPGGGGREGRSETK